MAMTEHMGTGVGDMDRSQWLVNELPAVPVTMARKKHATSDSQVSFNGIVEVIYLLEETYGIEVLWSVQPPTLMLWANPESMVVMRFLQENLAELLTERA